MEQKNALTVTQLNEYIKMMFDTQPMLNRLYVKGEISNFVNHRSGHFYFTLKDEGSLIKAVMFKSAAMKLKFVPENGIKLSQEEVFRFFREMGSISFMLTICRLTELVIFTLLLNS